MRSKIVKNIGFRVNSTRIRFSHGHVPTYMQLRVIEELLISQMRHALLITFFFGKTRVEIAAVGTMMPG